MTGRANFSYISLENALLSVYMLNRVSPPTRAPCLFALGTRQGEIGFYYINGLCRAIPANRGEIGRENMVA